MRPLILRSASACRKRLAGPDALLLALFGVVGGSTVCVFGESAAGARGLEGFFCIPQQPR